MSCLEMRRLPLEASSGSMVLEHVNVYCTHGLALDVNLGNMVRDKRLLRETKVSYLEEICVYKVMMRLSTPCRYPAWTP
jgi:hypothetical protein